MVKPKIVRPKWLVNRRRLLEKFPPLTEPIWLNTLQFYLRRDLQKLGIKATTRAEKVAGLRLYRITVVSKQFKKLNHSERQSIVWRLAQKEVDDKHLDHVSVLFTLTPDEIGQ